MTTKAHDHLTANPDLGPVRHAVDDLLEELVRYRSALDAIPGGSTSFVRVVQLSEPVRRAAARWDHAVLTQIPTFPHTTDDGWDDGA